MDVFPDMYAVSLYYVSTLAIAPFTEETKRDEGNKRHKTIVQMDGGKGLQQTDSRDFRDNNASRIKSKEYLVR